MPLGGLEGAQGEFQPLGNSQGRAGVGEGNKAKSLSPLGPEIATNISALSLLRFRTQQIYSLFSSGQSSRTPSLLSPPRGHKSVSSRAWAPPLPTPHQPGTKPHPPTAGRRVGALPGTSRRPRPSLIPGLACPPPAPLTLPPSPPYKANHFQFLKTPCCSICRKCCSLSLERL